MKKVKEEAALEKPGEVWKPSKEPKLDDLNPMVLATQRKLGKFHFEKKLPSEFEKCRFFTAYV